MSENNKTQVMTAIPAGADAPGPLIAVPGYNLSIPVEIRFRDTDAIGHVNNAVYLTYCEQARAHYWHFLFGAKAYAKCGFVLARAAMDFRTPCYSGETLLVGVKTIRLGNASFTQRYELRERDSGRLAAEGEHVLVTVDADGKPIPLPARIREAIKRHDGI